jgi:sulfur relay (sulfurtransferase) DsrC/TusE family protein
MFIIKTKDDKYIKIDKSLFAKFSNLAQTVTDNVKELVLNISSSHFELIKLYMEHHAKKETSSPIPPIQKSWTLDNVFEDEWDATYIKKIKEVEKDPALLDFCRTVEYLEMDTLLKKVTLAVTMNIIDRVGLESDRLAEEFAKLALKQS